MTPVKAGAEVKLIPVPAGKLVDVGVTGADVAGEDAGADDVVTTAGGEVAAGADDVAGAEDAAGDDDVATCDDVPDVPTAA